MTAARRALGDGLNNVIAGLGTERDRRFFTNYTLDFQSVQPRLEAMYMSSWLAGKIVSVPAEDMTREWVDLSWDGHDDAQDDDKAIRKAERKFDFRAKVLEALLWARLYGGAVIVIGLRGENLATPLVIENIKEGSLVSLIVKDRWHFTSSGARDMEPGPNFGLPISYLITPSSQQVHHTRVIRFNGRRLPESLWLANTYWDASELGHIIDNIKDYDAGRAGTASMLWDASVDVLRLALLKEQLAQKDGEKKILSRLLTMLRMKSMNRTIVLDKEDEYAQKSNTFSGVKDVLAQFVLDVSGAADIPITRLFGQSPAGLTATGESDIRNYYDHIGAKQESQLWGPLMKLYEVLIRSTLRRFPDDFQIEFRPLWQVTAPEKATIDKTKAERDAIYLKEGVVTEGLVARQLKADNTYSMMEDDDVEMAEELALQPDPIPVPGVPTPAGGAGPGTGAPAPGGAPAPAPAVPAPARARAA